MKSKVAVSDSCIFIDLYDLGLITLFFDLDLEFHTTSAVFLDLYSEQQQLLKAYQSMFKLTVHNLNQDDFLQIYSNKYPKSVSENDKSVIYIANKLNAFILSSDKTVRNCATNKGVECHGMIWILDNLVETSKLSRKDASLKLKQLFDANLIFQNNESLGIEINKRLKLWV